MSDDQRLQQAVQDELTWEPSVNAAHIGVTAKDGVITLLGHVDRFIEKEAAERAARRVADVRAVAEELDVRLPFSVSYGDDDIAAAVVARLQWDSSVPVDSVKPNVEKGWVTLTGQVEWQFQREAAMDDIRSLRGVVGVTNEITIKSKPNTTEIRASILTALDRSWMDPASITVTAKGGTVTLTGQVNSWYEHDEAGTTAWAAPGTTAVQNDIRVG